jgi:hypothetical protein
MRECALNDRLDMSITPDRAIYKRLLFVEALERILCLAACSIRKGTGHPVLVDLGAHATTDQLAGDSRRFGVL